DVAQYRAGDVWAEPDVEHAAEVLRYIFLHREEAAGRGENARRDMESGYSTQAVGRMVAKRLDVITNRAHFWELRANPTAAGYAELGDYAPREHLEYVELKRNLRHVVRA